MSYIHANSPLDEVVAEKESLKVRQLIQLILNKIKISFFTLLVCQDISTACLNTRC